MFISCEPRRVNEPCQQLTTGVVTLLLFGANQGSQGASMISSFDPKLCGCAAKHAKQRATYILPALCYHLAKSPVGHFLGP